MPQSLTVPDYELLNASLSHNTVIPDTNGLADSLQKLLSVTLVTTKSIRIADSSCMLNIWRGASSIPLNREYIRAFANYHHHFVGQRHTHNIFRTQSSSIIGCVQSGPVVHQKSSSRNPSLYVAWENQKLASLRAVDYLLTQPWMRICLCLPP